MLVYQRVNLHFPMVFLWFSYGFPMVFLWFWFSYGGPTIAMRRLGFLEKDLSAGQGVGREKAACAFCVIQLQVVQ